MCGSPGAVKPFAPWMAKIMSDDAITVVADDKVAEALGGVMGGEQSGCTEETVNVFLESAY